MENDEQVTIQHLRQMLIQKEYERDLFSMRLMQINQLVDRLNAAQLSEDEKNTLTVIKNITTHFEGNL